jgi:4,4'-diaponeurosporenoate glycosyltransferase
VDPIWFAAIGWLVGWWLWGRPARLAETSDPTPPVPGPRTTVIIPARDEAAVLPLLLGDLAADPDPMRRVVVVDDHSSDGTAELARSFAGVTVIDAPPLPEGWAGKPWACHTGATHVDLDDADIVVFLDADVRVAPGAIADAASQAARDGGVVSVQPFHATERPYEELSLVPGIVGLLGTGAGHLRRQPSGMFGPLLATSVADYRQAGGHAAVLSAVTEDVALGLRYRDAGLPVAIRLGGDAVRFRMYPSGIGQLAEGWTKNMATGAGSIPLHRSLGTFWWIAGAGSAAMSLSLVPGNDGVDPLVGALLYLAFVAQFALIGRRIGSFRALTFLTYPVALVVFMGLFVHSTWRLHVRRSVRWRGRTISVGGTGPAG